MKKLNIKIMVMLLCMAFGFIQLASAQFASSNDVYCYQYVKTVSDGVTSYNPNSAKKEKGPQYSSYDHELYFVIFQGNIMSYRHCDDVAGFRSVIMKDPDFYCFNAIKVVMDKDINNNKCDYRYNKAVSTSSKYTYQEYSWRTDWGSAWNGWLNLCFSFSLDKSEMIVWFPESKHKLDFIISA